jgi:RimK family alpha-L-glutamate ligase
VRVAILSARTGWHTDELCRALRDRGHAAQVHPYEGFVARLGARSGVPPRDEGRRRSQAAQLHCTGETLLDADAVMARIIPGGSLEQIIFRVDALHWLEEHGVPVMNRPVAIERSVDKFYTDALLHEAGVPTPETVVCEDVDQAMAAVRAFGTAIIKPLFGSMGQGLVRVEDVDTAWRVVRALAHVRPVFYIQRAVPNDGRDLRAFVVGGQVIGAIERLAPSGEWRANVSRGARATPIDLPPALQALAVRAVEAVGADYAGVDLLPSPDGTVFVLEVNGIPGWEGVQRATGVDVAGAIVDRLVAVAARRAAASPSTP